MKMNFDEIKNEAVKFLEWEERSPKLFVTYYSALLFAQHCVELAENRENDNDMDDLKKIYEVTINEQAKD